VNRSGFCADGLIHLGVPICAAVSADTSSAAAETTPVVGAAAAAFWAFIDEQIPCKVPAAAVSACGCPDTNDMHFSSPMWTDPKTTAAVTSGRSDHGPSVAQTDDLALGHYTYFLDGVNHVTNLWYPPMGGDGEDAPVLQMTGKVFGEAALIRRSPRGGSVSPARRW
jgi:hypothetical protein